MVWNKGVENVLGLSGVELIFFTVAGIGPCLRSVLKTVLVIQRLFYKGLFCYLYLADSEEVGMHKELGGNTARTNKLQ